MPWHWCEHFPCPTPLSASVSASASLAVLGVWVGAGLFLMVVVAPLWFRLLGVAEARSLSHATFRAYGTAQVTAGVVAAAFLAVATAWLLAGGAALAAVVAAVERWSVAPKLESASAEDPRWKQLHRRSVTLHVAALVLAAAVWLALVTGLLHVG